MKYFKKKIDKFIKRNFFVEMWYVGIVKLSKKEVVENDGLIKILNKVHWLDSKKQYTYYADPFPFIDSNKQLHIFVEEFNYFYKKGFICDLTLDKKHNIVEKKIIIKDKYHYSYPFLLKEKNIDYLMPESNSQNSLFLYKRNKDNQWKKERTLIENENIIDGTLFYYKKVYYLFYSIKTKNKDSELHISYSSSLLKKFFKHPKNPVRIGKRSARPAGNIFTYQDKIYRAGQDCSKTYGGAITINKIIKLSKTDYQEKKINQITAGNLQHNQGIHTINFIDDYAVIDAKKISFRFFKFGVNFTRRIKRLLFIK